MFLSADGQLRIAWPSYTYYSAQTPLAQIALASVCRAGLARQWRETECVDYSGRPTAYNLTSFREVRTLCLFPGSAHEAKATTK